MKDLEKKLRKQSQKETLYIDTDALWNQVEPNLKKKRKRLLPILIFWGLISIVSTTAYQYSLLGKVQKTDLTILTSTNENNSKNTLTEYTKTIGVDEIFSNTSPSSTEELNLKSTELSKIKFENKFLISNNKATTLTEDRPIYKSGFGISPSEQIDQNENQINNNLKTEIFEKKLSNYQKSTPSVHFASSSPSAIHKNEINAFDVQIPLIESKYPQYYNLVETNSRTTFYLSGGFSKSSIHLQLLNQEWQKHFSNRNIAESTLPSWHIRTGIIKSLKRDLILKAGLTYNENNSKSNSTLVTNERIVVDDVLLEKIIGPNGTEDVFGSITIQQTTTQIVERINKASSIDFNLSLLKQFQLKNNLKFNIGPHLSYNLNYLQRGFIHATPNEEYDLSIDKNEWFESNNGLSFGIETGIQYPINRKTSITAGLLYDYEITGINSKTYGIKDRRNALHIGLGIQQSF